MNTYSALVFKTAISSLCRLMTVCLLLVLCCCSDSPLEQKIKQIAADKGLQNRNSYLELVQMIKESPEQYESYLDSNGEIDAERLQRTIDSIGKSEDSAFSWNTMPYAADLNRQLSLRLMLERSGSMSGYDTRAGSGDFKRAINEVVNRFPDKTGTAGDNILIVNSGINPYKGSFQDFVQDRDIFYTTRNIGNASYTDFGKIFRYAMSDTVPGRITVLVTDMIYSPEGTGGVSSDKLRNEEASLMNHLGNTYRDKSMLIVRLKSDFKGTYYPYTSPRSGMPYGGWRPYYMIFMGNTPDMDRMLSGTAYASLRDFGSLPGFENYYYLGRNVIPAGYYAILPRSKEDLGLYSVAPGEGRNAMATNLCDVQADPSSGKFTFTLAVDLSAIPADPKYAMESGNWQTSAPGMLRVMEVLPVTDEMRNVRTNRFLSHATHVLKMEGDQRLSGDVQIRLLNRLPAWVKDGSSTDDRSLYTTSFPSTTFGLQDMVQGLYRGFYGTATAPDYTVYKLKIK